MPAYSVPYVHSGDPGYAPPLLRAPSPTSSIGTDYGPDETSIIESGLSNQEFAQMCQQRLQLDSIRPDELCANFDPLLPKPKNQEEEKILFTRVMHHLHIQVRRLQEDALFEQTILRGSLITEEQQPSSNDIDAILQSMMGTSIAPSSAPAAAASSATPLRDDFLRTKPMLDFPSPGGPGGSIFPDPASPHMPDSSTPANRRVTRNKGKTRR